MKYAWIARHTTQWPIGLACEVLGVSASGYFQHQRRKRLEYPKKRAHPENLSNEALLAYIKVIHAEVKQEYGWPRITKELYSKGNCPFTNWGMNNEFGFKAIDFNAIFQIILRPIYIVELIENKAFRLP